VLTGGQAMRNYQYNDDDVYKVIPGALLDDDLTLVSGLPERKSLHSRPLGDKRGGTKEERNLKCGHAGSPSGRV